MSTPDPFGDALAAQAQSSSNPDPYAAALAAHAAGNDAAESSTKPYSYLDQVKHTLLGEAQLGGATVGNILPNAGNAIIDLGSRISGNGPRKPIPTFPVGDAGKDLVNDVSGLIPKDDTVADKVQALRDQRLGKPSDTVADVTKQTGDVLSDALDIGTAGGLAKGALTAVKGVPAPDHILAKAQDLGLTVPPTTSNPTMLNRGLEGIAGKRNVEQGASLKNQPIFNNLVRQELGLPEDAPLTHDTLQEVRNEQGQHYAAVAAEPSIEFGSDYEKELGKITAKADKISSALPNYKSAGTSQIQDLVQSIKPEGGTMDGDTAVELSKTLRSDGNSYLNSAARTGSPTDRALGQAHMKAATAVENAIQDHLEAQGKPELADNWDNARRTIAKTYSIESALDGSGNVDASKLVKQSIKNKPLSGNLETIADFAAAYPNASKVSASKSSMPGFSPLDVATGLATGGATMATGHEPLTSILATAAPAVARVSARSLLTGPMGKALAVPRNPGPSWFDTPAGNATLGSIPLSQLMSGDQESK